jgi:predicted ATPase/class 3 adenylate cyclase
MDEVENLQKAIAALEAQRPLLGDTVVETALAPLREKLAALQAVQPVEQRKLVSVLFSDLVGFTAMSENIDPEEMREVLNIYLGRWGKCIEEHGGVVEKFIGDAVMAIYGLTITQEDDPRRAILTALKMQGELQSLNVELERAYQVRLAMRTGIHSGPVVVSTLGERKGQEFVAVGDTVNLASRLQAAAPENGILVSQDTFLLARGWFDFQPLDPIHVKGKRAAIPVYLVQGERSRQQRSSGRGIEGVATTLVGRQSELQQLEQLYQHSVARAKTQVVTILGDPGLGKSRLAGEFESWLAAQLPRPVLFKAFANEQTAQVPYQLLRDAISQHFNLLESELPDETRRKLELGLAPYFNQDAAMKAHFIGALLGFDFSASPFLGEVRNDPRQLRQRALHYLGQFWQALASRSPITVLLDDIHWADSASLEALLLIAQEHPDLPLLLLCLSRRRLYEVHPAWEKLQEQAAFTATQMPLQPLSQAASEQILAQALQKIEAVPADLQTLLVSTAEGNPFYLEELIKMLLDDGFIRLQAESGRWEIDSERLTSLRIPTTLTAVLQARLGSLQPQERVTLQQAATIGHTFWDALVQALQAANQPTVDHLSHMERRQMVTRLPTSNFEQCCEYQFNHALLREVVLNTVLKKKRQEYHKQIAHWLEATSTARQRSDEFAAFIAQHYQNAGEAQAAAPWFVRAGQRARSQGALVEARRFLEQALALLPRLDLQAYWEALLEHDRILGELGDLKARRADDEALYDLALELGDAEHLSTAYIQQASTYTYSGDFHKSIEALDAALQAARQSNLLPVEVFASAFKIFTLVRIGEIDQAGALVDQALAAAEALGDELELARTLSNLSAYYSASGDLAKALRINERQVEICHRNGLLVGEAVGTANLGYYYILLGYYAQAQSVLNRSYEIATSIGARQNRAYALLNLGLAHCRNGDFSASRQALERAIAELKEADDAFGKAAGLLYLAQALEGSGEIHQAGLVFNQAYDLYQQLEMPGNAQDARVGLARCLSQQGQVDRAGALADETWRHLEQHGAQSLEFPIAAYASCATIFLQANDQEKVFACLQNGVQELQSRARNISEPAWRQSYLENVPEHRLLLALWGKFAHGT